MLSLLLVLTAAFAVLAWRDLHTGLLLMAAVLPSYLLRTEVLGIPTTLLELLVVAFLIVWLVKGGWRQPLSQSPYVPVGLLLLSATISVFVAPDFVNALGVWKAYFVEPILLFFVIRHELQHGGLNESSLFKALGLTAIVLSLVAIFQWLTGAGLPIPWDIERRVTSVFDYPNALGLSLGPILIIGVLSLCRNGGWRGAWLWSASADERLRVEHRQSLHRARTRREFIFWFIVVLLSSIAIVLAQSEAAIVSVVATLLLAGFLHKKTRIFSSSLIVLFILLILLVPPLASKLTLQDYSGQVRLSQWSETSDMLEDRWLLGAGLSGYPTIFEPYHQATHLEIFQYPHNIVLNIWVELGLLGLIAFTILAWQVVLTTWRRLHPSLKLRAAGKPAATTSSTFPPSNLPTIAFFALLQMTIHGLVDVPYFKNDLALLTWILLAFVFAYARPTTPATPS